MRVEAKARNHVALLSMSLLQAMLLNMMGCNYTHFAHHVLLPKSVRVDEIPSYLNRLCSSSPRISIIVSLNRSALLSIELIIKGRSASITELEFCQIIGMGPMRTRLGQHTFD
jgi:hypothetical protein